LGTVGGVEIAVGVSWLILLPGVGLGIFAGIDPGSGSLVGRALVAGAGSVLLWVSVVAHELGHAAAARRDGVVVERVVVFLLGGYSEMDLDAARPEQEWRVAAAGPIASGFMALVLVAVASVAPASGGLDGMLRLLAVVNGGVAVFNAVPAFPLDGGRMLRASLVRRGRSPAAAERTAKGAGMVLGLGMVLGGIGLSLLGSGASLLAVPIGLLVLVMAAAVDSNTHRLPIAEEI
jgi:Zn-dependent protease